MRGYSLITVCSIGIINCCALLVLAENIQMHTDDYWQKVCVSNLVIYGTQSRYSIRHAASADTGGSLPGSPRDALHLKL